MLLLEVAMLMETGAKNLRISFVLSFSPLLPFSRTSHFGKFREKKLSRKGQKKGETAKVSFFEVCTINDTNDNNNSVTNGRTILIYKFN